MIESMLEPLVSSRFLKEEKYRTGHIKVINPVEGRRIIGVHVPEMKTLARKLALSETEALRMLSEFRACYDKDPFSLLYEETVVWGLVIDYLKVSWEIRAGLLRDFVPVLDNWGVCDTFCSNAKWVNDKAALWDFLSPYWASDREFEVRFAVVMSMTSLLDEQYFPLICRKFESLDMSRIKSNYNPASVSGYVSVDGYNTVNGYVTARGYGTVKGDSPHYVNMAIAWFLATSLAKFPEQTRSYVNMSSLPDNIIRLYVRKARESFRTRDVSPL